MGDLLNTDGPNLLPSTIAPPPTNGGLPPVLTNPLNTPPAGSLSQQMGGFGAAQPAQVNPPTRLDQDQAKLHDLQDNGSGVQQFQGRHPVIGGIIHGLDTAAKILAPRIEPLIPGSEGNHQVQLGQAQGVVNQDQAGEQAAAQLEDTNSQTSARKAGAEKNEAIALEDTPVPVDPAVAQQIGMPELTGIPLTPAHLRQLIAGKHNNDAKITQTGMNNATSTANNAATNQTHVTTTGMNNKTSAANNAATNATKVQTKGMGDATSAANNQRTVDAKAAPGTPGAPKPTVADRNRQSLAKIALDSLADVEDVVKRRPEKIGAMAGRFTNVEQMIGSNDPDVVAIGNAVHNFAMANAGIHGSRSHENVVDAENMLLNHMRNGAQGMQGGIDVNRKNLQRIIDGGAPAAAQGGAPTPQTHVFDSGAYAAKHPEADMNAVKAAAQKQGYTVK